MNKTFIELNGRQLDVRLTLGAIEDYCDELRGVCAENGIQITELSTHLQGQLVAVHPAYDELFDGFASI